MIFKVEKLGPVEHAEIDLSNDLILLTGPNGTGKTYVAWGLVWAAADVARPRHGHEGSRTSRLRLQRLAPARVAVRVSWRAGMIETHTHGP